MTPQDIRAIRQQRELTQVELAQLLGVAPGTVRNWEQGIRKPNGSACILLNQMKLQTTEKQS